MYQDIGGNMKENKKQIKDLKNISGGMSFKDVKAETNAMLAAIISEEQRQKRSSGM